MGEVIYVSFKKRIPIKPLFADGGISEDMTRVDLSEYISKEFLAQQYHDGVMLGFLKPYDDLAFVKGEISMEVRENLEDIICNHDKPNAPWRRKDDNA